MPKVPTYQFSVGVPRGGIGVMDTINLSTPYARAVSGVGEMLQARGAQLLQEYDATRAYDAFNQLRDEARGKISELYEREGAAAHGIQSEYEEWERQARDKVRKSNLTAFSQQSMFDKLADQHRASDLNGLAAHEAQQHKVFKKQTFEGLLNVADREVRANALDDAAVNSTISEVFDASDRLYPGQNKTAEKMATLQVLRFSHLREVIDKNPKLAAEKIEQYKKDLGDKYYDLKKLLESNTGDLSLEGALVTLQDKYKGNFYGMLAYLKSPENRKSLGLEFETAGKLENRIKSWISERESMESQAVTDMHRRQEANAAQLYGQLAKEKDAVKRQAIIASLPDMVKNRQISSGDFKALTKEIESGADEDDLDAIAELEDAISRHEDATSRTIEMHRQGRIKTTTADNYLKASSSRPVAEGLSYLKTALGVGEGVYMPDARERLAEAEKLYFEKIRQDPKTPPMSIATSLVSAYKHSSIRTLRGSRKPQFMGAGNMRNPNDLQNARIATIEAFRGGQMGDPNDPKTIELYKQEIENIDRLFQQAMQVYLMDESAGDNEQVQKTIEKSRKSMGQY